MTAAEVPQPGVPVEDGLHEWPVARSVPGGLASEGRPVAARYLFNLGEPVTTGDAELVTGGMEQSPTKPRTQPGGVCGSESDRESANPGPELGVTQRRCIPLAGRPTWNRNKKTAGLFPSNY